ncbi:PxKF domain-containing protein [Mesobacillus jeotgali]|uniref:PxKF domain-containing protein n=1 Tax=Mesobacillus jeotgali TaxID=129985 RepID=UPI0009A67C22|nr:PxKF domain-containing protein [Mesobacillus jeotgali]
MKKISFRNVLSKKALSAVTALAISGLVPAGFALAGELVVTSEFVASSANVYVEQGETQSFNLIVSSNGSVTDADVSLPTLFTLDANGTFSSSNTDTVKLTADVRSKSVPATIQVDPKLGPGTYTFKFNKDNFSYTNNNQQGAKLGDDYSDTITFVVTKKQVQDTTAPVVTATPDKVANTHSWYNENVTVNFSAVDEEGGSGVNESTISSPRTFEVDGVHEGITGTAYDKAGNLGTSAPITIKLDKTAPTITGKATTEPNENGWYNRDVIVKFEADDYLSGVEKYTQPVTLSTEGENQSATGTATDFAGNSSSISVNGIKIDKTEPEISLPAKGTFKLNEKVSWSASDSLSGVENTSGTIDTSKPGTHIVELTATDNAGNIETQEFTYTVEYNFGGVLQPINSNGSSIFKAGSTVPVKFQLTDFSGAYVSSANASISIAKVNESVQGTVTESIVTSTANTGNEFRYDPAANQYIYNLSTKGLSTGTYLITVKLDDKTAYTVKMSLK